MPRVTLGEDQQVGGVGENLVRFHMFNKFVKIQDMAIFKEDEIFGAEIPNGLEIRG